MLEASKVDHEDDISSRPVDEKHEQPDMHLGGLWEVPPLIEHMDQALNCIDVALTAIKGKEWDAAQRYLDIGNDLTRSCEAQY